MKKEKVKIGLLKMSLYQNGLTMYRNVNKKYRPGFSVTKNIDCSTKFSILL